MILWNFERRERLHCQEGSASPYDAEAVLRIGLIGSRHLGFDPLHHASTGFELAGGFENAFTARQRCADCRLFCCVDPRPTNRFPAPGALLSRPGKSGVYPFLDDCALELGKYAEHLEERPPGRGSRVDRLLFEIEIASGGVEFAQKADEVLQ